MNTLNEICKKDTKYVKAIEELSVVKNAVELLGGRRKKEGGENGNGSRRDKEKQEQGAECERNEGKEEGMILTELRVKEKIGLLALLSGLVKRGVQMEDEEGLKEVGMTLEEEGNKHVEEDIDGEGEEEKREWEELSERACMFVRLLEKMKARREGKKSETLRMLKRMSETEGKLEAANAVNEKLSEEIIALKAELGRLKIDQKEERYQVNKVSEIKLLAGMRSLFGDWSILKVENNSIIHSSEPVFTSVFMGEKLNNSVHRMFESFVILSC